MRMGTRSVLFGAHMFCIHPFVIARAWYKLWGFRTIRDPYIGDISLRNWRLWVVFAIHDLGYWGCRDMDDAEGEDHPRWAAARARRWWGDPWFSFCFYHSRFLARTDNAEISVLAIA